MKEILEDRREETAKFTTAAICIAVAFAVGVWLGTSLTEEQPEEKPEQVTQVVEIPCFQDSLDDWSTLQMAIVMTESKFNPTVVGTGQDFGIFQITDIYTKELNRIQKKTHYLHEDAFDIERAIVMFNTMQEYYNPEKDLDKVFRYHNKASWYRKRVEKNILFIQRMEEVRKAILESQGKTYL